MRDISEKLASHVFRFFQLNNIRFKFLNKFIDRMCYKPDFIVRRNNKLCVQITGTNLFYPLSNFCHRFCNAAGNDNAHSNDHKQNTTSDNNYYRADLTDLSLHFLERKAQTYIFQFAKTYFLRWLFYYLCHIQEIAVDSYAMAYIVPDAISFCVLNFRTTQVVLHTGDFRKRNIRVSENIALFVDQGNTKVFKAANLFYLLVDLRKRIRRIFLKHEEDQICLTA